MKDVPLILLMVQNSKTTTRDCSKKPCKWWDGQLQFPQLVSWSRISEPSTVCLTKPQGLATGAIGPEDLQTVLSNSVHRKDDLSAK